MQWGRPLWTKVTLLKENKYKTHYPLHKKNKKICMCCVFNGEKMETGLRYVNYRASNENLMERTG